MTGTQTGTLYIENMLFGLPEMISRVELPDVSAPPPPSVLQPKSVPRRKCAACKIVVHTTCIAQLEKVCAATQPSVPFLGMLKFS